MEQHKVGCRVCVEEDANKEGHLDPEQAWIYGHAIFCKYHKPVYARPYQKDKVK